MKIDRRLAAAALAWAASWSASAQSVQWEVVDRFRLLDRAEHARDLYNQVRTAPERASRGGSRSYPSPLASLSTHYSVPAIAPTAWDPAAQAYRAGYAHPAGWEVKVSVPAWKSLDCDWTLQSSGARIAGPCGATVLKGVQATDQVTVAAAGGARREELAAPIAIEHRRVVVMGDSFASGEGVPEINQEVENDGQGGLSFGKFAYWWDQKCHRSLLSAGVQASLKWAMADPRRSVTTLSYACSGAEIGRIAGEPVGDGGILAGYAGRETREQLRTRRHERERLSRFEVSLHESDVEPLPSQLNQAIRDLCPVAADRSTAVWTCPQPLARPDLLVLGIGGNDVGFGAILLKAVIKECEVDCVRRISGKGFAALDASYAEMAGLINASLAPARTLMLDYGDPTRDEKGRFCSIDGSPARLFRTPSPVPVLQITSKEYEAAYKLVIEPLNKAGDRLVAANAGRGWARLRFMEAATRTKGLCSLQSWFNSGWASYMKQHNLPGAFFSSGTAHPNIIYQSRQADAIVDWMARNGF